jgi:hypothetical protein
VAKGYEALPGSAGGVQQKTPQIGFFQVQRPVVANIKPRSIIAIQNHFKLVEIQVA